VNGVGEADESASGGPARPGVERTGRHRAGESARQALAGVATITAVRPGDVDGQPLTRAVFEYAARRPGQPLALLQAGCTTAGDDPDIGKLRAAGCDVAVTLIEDDNRVSRAAVTARRDLVTCTLCDLRIAPFVPRSFDIVHCARLLERISHAELVLDRFVEALKPGGLLLLQTGDRECATGFLDRVLPRPLRAMIWRNMRPGQPGPYRPVYERLVSERGVESYALSRGLVIAQRETLSVPGGRRRPPAAQFAGRLAVAVSRGRLTCAHDELRYVIRKPESGCARVL